MVRKKNIPTNKEILAIIKALDDAPIPMENRKIWPPLTKKQKRELLKL